MKYALIIVGVLGALAAWFFYQVAKDDVLMTPHSSVDSMFDVGLNLR